MDHTTKSIRLLRYLPRFSDKNLFKNVFNDPKNKFVKGPNRPRYPVKSNEERQRWHPLGYERGGTPWYLKVPEEKYYKNFDARRQYPPLSLHQLQLLIDQKLLDIDKPIDLASIIRTNHFHIDPSENHYGYHLTLDGMDRFCSCINIEVQYAREPVIAAIERFGGRITTVFFDIKSIAALSNPYSFFKTGEPIPKRLIPPPNAIDYYTDPKNRGYLADPKEIEKERFMLAQKYGYEIPEIEDEAKRKMLAIKKSVRQVFFGLQAGQVVNLKDKEILEPIDNNLRKYYGLPALDDVNEEQFSSSSANK